ncbi:hypothetical protein AVDCRST_MAG81-578 [uncultured Synechococcales cyanobacterium]|uniref:Uncharacterized protein n=1 Tax=uncultured Synechococcales cyanobacterium TaxID=1936017 RepID=A0A6J4UVE9_9CYAN|nr:hypothetical protein AVDCRST_MAG81-578 [uncultured Synechococcales cyanobacterium]
MAGGISFDSLSLSGSNIILTASNETLVSLTEWIPLNSNGC